MSPTSDNLLDIARFAFPPVWPFLHFDIQDDDRRFGQHKNGFATDMIPPYLKPEHGKRKKKSGRMAGHHEIREG